ncbi:MAG TPA: DUF4124 domain-containing protein [Usitatibacter sp.]|nr:DUF4124 domain-containing protein [Usitatibacter sp.]
MKTVWIAAVALLASPSAFAQTTIYKYVDESGRITYSNKPMKGGVVIDLEPLTTIPGTPAGVLVNRAGAAPAATPVMEKSDEPRAEARPAVAVVTPVPGAKAMLASVSVEPSLQKRRDSERRRILEDELKTEEEALTSVRNSLLLEQQNPQLIAAVRIAQQTADPSPAQLAEFRNNIEKASGRIRGLQATVAEHEKNVEALKKELGALKP